MSDDWIGDEPFEQMTQFAQMYKWAVVRQDDAGNRFLVKDKLILKEANELVREYEAKGHKQAYTAEKYMHDAIKELNLFGEI